MQITYRRLPCGAVVPHTGWEERHPGVHFRAAVVADLHDEPYGKLMEALRRIAPDLILIPGDLTENLTVLTDESGKSDRPGLGFLAEAAALAPTFYAWGNHETGAGHINLGKPMRESVAQRSILPCWQDIIRASGAVLLDQSYTVYRGLVLGGMRSGLLNPGRMPDLDWLDGFCRRATGFCSATSRSILTVTCGIIPLTCLLRDTHTAGNGACSDGACSRRIRGCFPSIRAASMRGVWSSRAGCPIP